MTLMARVETSSVAFEETKEVAALTAPIVRRGTLRYVRPDRLEMRVETPYFERMEIVGNQLTIESQARRPACRPGRRTGPGGVGGQHTRDAGGRPRHVGAPFRVPVAADRRRAGPLRCCQSNRRLSGVIERVTIDGTQAQLTRIEVDERMGDPDGAGRAAGSPGDERTPLDAWPVGWSLVAVAVSHGARWRSKWTATSRRSCPAARRPRSAFSAASCAMASVSRLLLVEIAHDDPLRLAAISRSMVTRAGCIAGVPLCGQWRRCAQCRRTGADRAPSLSVERSRRCSAISRRRRCVPRWKSGWKGWPAAAVCWKSAGWPTIRRARPLHILSHLAPQVQPKRIDGVWFARSGDAALLVAQTTAAWLGSRRAATGDRRVDAAFDSAGRTPPRKCASRARER